MDLLLARLGALGAVEPDRRRVHAGRADVAVAALAAHPRLAYFRALLRAARTSLAAPPLMRNGLSPEEAKVRAGLVCGSAGSRGGGGCSGYRTAAREPTGCSIAVLICKFCIQYETMNVCQKETAIVLRTVPLLIALGRVVLDTAMT